LSVGLRLTPFGARYTIPKRKHRIINKKFPLDAYIKRRAIDGSEISPINDVRLIDPIFRTKEVIKITATYGNII